MHIKTMFLSIMLLNILIGSLVVNIVNASPELWNQTYGGPEGDYVRMVIETSDGGFALLGITRDDSGQNLNGSLIKTDMYGNMEWNQTYTESDIYSLDSIVQTSDGGYAIVGSHLLFKTDIYGNIEWTREYDKNKTHSLILTSDGGFAISGGNRLIKTDANGEIEWTNTYNGGAARYLIETSDGGYVLAGTIGSDLFKAGDLWVGKTDQYGELTWSQTFGGSGYEFGGPLVETADDGYAVLGLNNGSMYGGGNLWLIKMDGSGNMEWNQTYGSTSTHSLIKTSDGGFAIAGGNRLIKTDAHGNLEWTYTYGGTNQEYFTSIVETSNGGYALGGYLSSIDVVGKTDFWLIKTDIQGIPEFSSWIILSLFGTIILVVLFYRKKLYKTSK